MQSLLERIRNKVEYGLKDSKKVACQLEESSYSKRMKNVLNGRTLNIILGEVGFICFLSPINFLTAFS